MKKIIRLTERDLTRIVKRVLNESITMTQPWVQLSEVKPGDGFRYNEEHDHLRHLRGGQERSNYNGYRIITNPTRSTPFFKDGTGSYNILTVKSFDPNTKVVTFTNGVSIGPEGVNENYYKRRRRY
jgi:hypothetical protein